MSLVTENVEGIPGGEGASVVSIDVYRVTYETWELECYYRWRVTASCDTHNTSYTWFHDRSEYREITFRTAVLLYTENHIIDEGSDTGSASRVEDHFRHNHCRWDPPGIGR